MYHIVSNVTGPSKLLSQERCTTVETNQWPFRSCPFVIELRNDFFLYKSFFVNSILSSSLVGLGTIRISYFRA